MGIISSWIRVQRSKFWGIISDVLLLCLNLGRLFGFPQHMPLIVPKKISEWQCSFLYKPWLRIIDFLDPLSRLLFERYASSVIKREENQMNKTHFLVLRCWSIVFNRKYRLVLFFKPMPLDYILQLFGYRELDSTNKDSPLHYLTHVFRWVMWSKSFTKDI